MAAFLGLGGLAVINGSDTLLAAAIWAAVVVGHFAVGTFLWLEEHRYGWVALGLGVPLLWVLALAPFVFLEKLPAAGWAMVPVGLLALAAAIIPFGRRERQRAQKTSLAVRRELSAE